MAAPKPSEQKTSITRTIDPALLASIQALVALVRAKMRDYAELNRLTDGKESSDREIAMALLLAVEDYNTTPPLLDSVTMVSFPSKDLLVNGAIIQLLESLGLLQTRNQMQYSDGQGVQVSVSEKPQMLMQWIRDFSNKYETKKQRLKQAINLQQALGNMTGTSSEYLAVNGYFDALGTKD